jgi:hypothetical protein
MSRPPAVQVMRKLGLEPDPWQVEVLQGGHPRLLLNCCRQAGKSTAVALLGLVEAIWVPYTQVLLRSRSHRQSAERFRTVADFYRRLGGPFQKRLTAEELQLTNGSRIVCLPCREETVRGYARHHARARRPAASDEPPSSSAAGGVAPARRRPPAWWLRLNDERIWTRLI